MNTLPDMPPNLDLMLRRVDRALTLPTAVIPLQLGERGERVLLAIVVAFGALGTLATPAAASLPERVVYVPESGWVDAETVPGLPKSVRDGDRLELALVGAKNDGGGGAAPATGSTPSSADAPPEPAHAAALGRKVSLNNSSAAELERLPGIGPALASRIVAGRPYRSMADLDRVRGIGAKSLARLAPLVEP